MPSIFKRDKEKQGRRSGRDYWKRVKRAWNKRRRKRREVGAGYDN
jgi:hypothetical protein